MTTRHCQPESSFAQSLSKRRIGFCLSLLAVLLLADSAPMYGQAVFGSIAGTVNDASGAAVPSAEVTVTDEAKGTSQTVQSDANGYYRVDRLTPDAYDIKVSASGFSVSETHGVVVTANGEPKINLILRVASDSQTIEVTAAPPPLQTNNAQVSDRIPSQTLQDVPSSTRNFAQFQQLTAGTSTSPSNNALAQNPQGSPYYSINGQNFGTQAWTIVERSHSGNLLISELPFGKGKAFLNSSGAMNYIVGGWRMSGDSTWMSGLPFTPIYAECASDQDVDTSGIDCRPNGSASGFALGARALNSTKHSVTYFTPVGPLASSGSQSGPFQRPAFGNIGRNSFVGPAEFLADASLIKHFALLEHLDGQFQFQAFNVFNHPALAVPGNKCIDCTTGTPGQITSLDPNVGMRQLQFAVRLAF